MRLVFLYDGMVCRCVFAVQVSPLAVAVDGVLVMAVVGMLTRVSSKLDTATPAPQSVQVVEVVADNLAPVVPWYVERLVVNRTALRITFSSRGVLPETVAFLASIANAQLQFATVQHSDVLAPIEQLCQMVSEHNWASYPPPPSSVITPVALLQT